MRGLTLASALAVLVLTAGCSPEGEGGAARGRAGAKILVVTSFYPLAEAATRVAGGQAEVVNLTPAGTEPHDLELSPRQVDQLEDAGLVLYVGQGFQPAVENVVERRRGPTVDVLDGLPLDTGPVRADRDEEEALDAHFWLDPTLMERAAARIQEALGEVRPGARSEFARNAAAYRAELQTLDREYQSTLASCQRRQIVTSHAAFHYLAKRYGLTQEPIAGLSLEAEPDPQRLAALADSVRRTGATTIFHETLVSPRLAQTLARQTGTRTAVLDPIEGLSEEQVDQGADYASVMRQNLASLKEALGCR